MDEPSHRSQWLCSMMGCTGLCIYVSNQCDMSLLSGGLHRLKSVTKAEGPLDGIKSYDCDKSEPSNGRTLAVDLHDKGWFLLGLLA